MNNSLQTFKALTYSAVCVSALVACGDGSSNDSTTAVSGGGLVGAVPTAVIESDAITFASLNGTWLGVCEERRIPPSGIVVPGVTPPPTTPYGWTQDSLNFSTSAAGVNLATSTERYYDSAGCSGEPFATVIYPTATVVVTGTKTIATATVLKLRATTPAVAPTFLGTGVTLSQSCGLSLPGQELRETVVITFASGVLSCISVPTAAVQGKQVLALVNGVASFDSGDDDIVDAAGYPDALLPAAVGRYTKQ